MAGTLPTKRYNSLKKLIHILVLCPLFLMAGCGGGGGSSPAEPQMKPKPSQPIPPTNPSQPIPPTNPSQPIQPIVSGAPVCPVGVSAVSQDGFAVTVDFDTPGVDSMGRQVTAVCSPPPGALFEVGTHEVTCERSDNPGAQCMFSVSVTMETGPADGGICDRTVQVRDAIVDLIPGIHTCSAVTNAHLAAVTGSLNLKSTGISSLKSGDFSGLTNLRSLHLKDNQLTTLPADIFDGLQSLRTLRLHSNRLQSLPSNVFAGIRQVDILDLEFNDLTALPDGLFAGLNLKFLGLEGNQIQTLRTGMFDALGGSLILDLSHNALTTLEDGVFADLEDLVWLDLANNQLQTLPIRVFAGLINMQTLHLEQNPGADFTFTMTLERVSNTNKVVVVVPEGAPFDMTTTISVAGGELPVGVSTVTVPVGNTRSDEIVITPLAGATVSLGAAPPPPVPPTSAFDGIATAVGNPLMVAGLQGRSVQGLLRLSVADVEVQEGVDAVLTFVVTLDRPPSATVKVHWATSDGTATAGSDYTAASGMLSFGAGETSMTIPVAVLNDTLDEGSETLMLTLSNASGAYLADAQATGTITNTDHMPGAWMARFGRTVADQVLEAVTDRMAAPRTAATQVNLAGYPIGFSNGPSNHSGQENREEAQRLTLLADRLDDTGHPGNGDP